MRPRVDLLRAEVPARHSFWVKLEQDQRGHGGQNGVSRRYRIGVEVREVKGVDLAGLKGTW